MTRVKNLVWNPWRTQNGQQFWHTQKKNDFILSWLSFQSIVFGVLNVCRKDRARIYFCLEGALAHIRICKGFKSPVMTFLLSEKHKEMAKIFWRSHIHLKWGGKWLLGECTENPFFSARAAFSVSHNNKAIIFINFPPSPVLPLSPFLSIYFSTCTSICM